MEEEIESSVGTALAARGLRLGTSPGKGRGLFATKSFSRGEVLLEQGPFVAILTENMDRRCDGCYKEGLNYRRCSFCKAVYYCSITCQQSERNIHKEECCCLVTLMEEKGRTLTSSLRLMLRLLVKKHLQKEGVVPFDTLNNYQVVELLPTHIQEIPEHQLILYAQMATLVKSTCTLGNVETKEITHNFCRFACNAHTICDEELRPLGTGLYPVLSILNHSCQPNSVLLFEGKEAFVRAISPISEGSEVTVSYVDLGEPMSIRRKSLKEQYFFDCSCPRCLDQDDGRLEELKCLKKKCKGILLPDSGNSEIMICQTCNERHDKRTLLKRMEESNASSTEATRLLCAGNYVDAKYLFEHVNQLQAQLFQKYSIQRLKTYDNLLKVCMALEDWPAALAYCHQALPAYERAYVPYHPLIGLQYYTCGKLAWYLGKTQEAINAYRKAYDILQVTHGSNAELVKALAQALQEAELEASYFVGRLNLE